MSCACQFDGSKVISLCGAHNQLVSELAKFRIADYAAQIVEIVNEELGDWGGSERRTVEGRKLALLERFKKIT